VLYVGGRQLREFLHAREETRLKDAREQRAHEIQMALIASAASKDANTVVLEKSPPPATELPNSDPASRRTNSRLKPTEGGNMKLLSRYGPLLLLICSLVFGAVAATPSPNSNDKQQITKQSPDVQTAILAERTFNVEGKLMGQLEIERLDATREVIVLPTAPPRAVDHVPLY
jgi:hypothetical protein